jgi:hypothetical protein
VTLKQLVQEIVLFYDSYSLFVENLCIASADATGSNKVGKVWHCNLPGPLASFVTSGSRWSLVASFVPWLL